MTERSFHILQRLLVCPLCKGKLEFALDVVECTSCGIKISQRRDDCFDLLPPHALENEGSKWRDPQREMEEWYEDLIVDPDAACNCFVNDYVPYAPVMAALSGEVLDVGGGIGVVQHYLPRDTQYTVGDPSLNWLEAEWSTLAESFPCLRAKPSFVRGVGECLSFPAQTFDAVPSFWSLNHVSDPELVFDKACRVLRPSGRFLAILEAMVPESNRDLTHGTLLDSELEPVDGNMGSESLMASSEQECRVQSDRLRIPSGIGARRNAS